jgi:hypothetical protein
VRALLQRRDWHETPRGELSSALSDLKTIERRARRAGVELGEPVVELQKTLEKIRRERGGGWRKAAGLL